MKRLVFVIPAAILALAVSLAYGAEGAPWKPAGGAGAADPAAKPAEGPAAPAAPGDLKTGLSPAQYKSLIKPIEDAVAEAEKILELAKKEGEKPREKQNPATIAGMKLRAAEFYLNASGKAKTAIGRLPKDKESAKSTIASQYEKPNKQKALDILLELAKAAQDKKDYAAAVALYKRVLVVDTENTTAKEALKQIEQDVKTAQANGKSGQGAAGGDKKADPNVDKPWENSSGKPANGWSHYGQKSYGQGYGGGW